MLSAKSCFRIVVWTAARRKTAQKVASFTFFTLFGGCSKVLLTGLKSGGFIDYVLRFTCSEWHGQNKGQDWFWSIGGLNFKALKLNYLNELWGSTCFSFIFIDYHWNLPSPLDHIDPLYRSWIGTINNHHHSAGEPPRSAGDQTSNRWSVGEPNSGSVFEQWVILSKGFETKRFVVKKWDILALNPKTSSTVDQLHH